MVKTSDIFIIAPVSVSLIERMEIEFNIAEATYVEKNVANGRLYVSPRIAEKDFELFRDDLSKSSEQEGKLRGAKKEISAVKSPYSQYEFFLNPPKTFIHYLFSRPHPQQAEETDVLIGYLLIGGAETVNFTEGIPNISKGVFPLFFKISRGIFAEIGRKVSKEVYQEFPYEINIEKMRQLVESNPEIKKELFATHQTFEIREPISIKPSVREAIDALKELDSKSWRTWVEERVMEKKHLLETQGKSGFELINELSAYKMEVSEQLRDKLREQEKFFDMMGLSFSLGNISRFPIEGDIYVKELALTFPLPFSRCRTFPSEISRYDPVRMQATWSDFKVSKQEEVHLDMLIPHGELAKVQKISGEIHMHLMADETRSLSLISFIHPQQICDPRGIPVVEELKKWRLLQTQAGATCVTQIDVRSVYVRRIYNTQRRMEFEEAHPRKAYELIKNILYALAVEVIFEEEPMEVSRPDQEGVKEFYVMARGTKYIDITPVYIDVIVEGKSFMIHEERTTDTETLKTSLKKIIKEHGNTRITLHGSSSNLEILNKFMDQLRDDIKSQMMSLS
jgi:hypothetical protein